MAQFEYDFSEVSLRIVHLTFTRLVAVREADALGSNYLAFDLYKSLYASDPTRFLVTGALHSNSGQDIPHISLTVRLGDRYSHKLHLYCFFKAKKVVCSHVTVLEPGCDQPKLLVKFNAY